MTQQELLNEFLSLPPEAQRQLMDFIAFLRQRYAVVESASQSPDIDLINDSFIGMWSDRQDLADSTAWVRGIRANEWSKSHD
ncbi:hypothetical protein CDG76_10975 [Nostoc sp. 'Peltigera membranacea cyanobiont' 210A]|uniref:hypothetical protein n=1 Tax=Nostoc sp. 'Peltigera membranacea cyanobiont' 210A TaxID=2014529 RepID=UPI000B9587CE|nr:hypothetical protein [Nostoc sp. 'Peltigera membranacea cyanobiont' 210A]OYD95470.1 hypothetical protein CDG76_10975 [Nostoc sp. 'Peltigera membranacea cyanobiont' 210A]